MNWKSITLLFATIVSSITVTEISAKNVKIDTQNTSLVLEAEKGKNCVISITAEKFLKTMRRLCALQAEKFIQHIPIME